MGKFKLLALTVLILMCTIPISAAKFANKTGKQTTSYVGLGNKNEDLAFAYFTNSKKEIKQVSFTLYGTVANISTLKVYARPYDSKDGDSSSGLSVTDQQIWDYRDPIGKSGAILLATINSIPEAGVITTITTDGELPTGDYMIYLTADIKENVELKGLTVEKKYVGGAINSFDNNAITTALVNGGESRIFVKNRQLLFAPGDNYSKYYRIPSIAKATDGSLIALSDARKYRIYDIQNDIDIICRRSLDNGKTWGDPITIVQAKNGKQDSYSSDAVGYGDAALAVLPNGDILCTMVSGGALQNNGWGTKTTNWYTISHDNGQTWGELKEIDTDLYYKIRGNIAPGSLCVAKKGILAGKVLACFRNYAKQISFTTFMTPMNNNSIFVYDPQKASWSKLKIGKNEEFGDNTDESHLVELSENKFLVSMRGGTGNRTFKLLTINSATNGTITDISSDISATNACNGDIIRYTDNNNKTYLLQSIPTGSASDTKGNSTRSNLTIFTAPDFDTNQTSINWTSSLLISDPLAVMEEDAQYSTMTIENDNTIGMVFEEYPNIVFKEQNNRSDCMQSIWYMKLRIEDIIGDAVTPATERLKAPAISPESTSYYIADKNDRPNIVITNQNSLEKTSTHYDVYVYTKGSDEVKSTKSGTFEGESLSLPWISESISEGTTVKVVAYCTKTGYDNSDSAIKQYSFTNNLRNIKLVVMPLDGAGNPTLTVAGVGQYNAFKAMRVAEGKKVTINAPSDKVYQFQKFTYDQSGNVLLSSKISVTSDNINNYQISFNLPSKATLADNDADTLAVYVWYKSDTNYGMMSDTYVYTGAESNYNKYYPEVPDFNSDYKSFWCTSANETAWPTNISASLDFGNASKSANETNTISFPQAKDESSFIYGINVCVRILPDNGTAHNLNGIVMLKKDGEFLKNNDGKYVYYLLNGVSNPYASTSAIYTGAKGAMNWYQYGKYSTKAVSNDSAIPTRIDNCTFVVSNDNESLDSFDAIVYIVKDNLTSVDTLTDGGGYVYSIDYMGKKSDIPTSATLTQYEGLSIIGGNGEAIISCQTPTLVEIYNTLGIRVASVNVDGSTSISLPCGIYIANGKKFIVR